MFKRVPENVDHMKSHAQLVNVQDFGDKPLIILRAKQLDSRYDPPFVPDDIAAEMTRLFDGAEDGFKKLSTNTRIVYSQSEKHHLHIADPELVVNMIKDLQN